jgi:hypothetical protein
MSMLAAPIQPLDHQASGWRLRGVATAPTVDVVSTRPSFKRSSWMMDWHFAPLTQGLSGNRVGSCCQNASRFLAPFKEAFWLVLRQFLERNLTENTVVARRAYGTPELME